MPKSPIMLHEIDSAQELAINALLKGATDEEAGKAASVTRKTVGIWKSTHPAFRAELKNRKAAIWQALQQSVVELHHDSLKAISKAVKDGDVSTARWVLERSNIEEIFTKSMVDMKVTDTTSEIEYKLILCNLAEKEERKRAFSDYQTYCDETMERPTVEN